MSFRTTCASAVVVLTALFCSIAPANVVVFDNPDVTTFNNNGGNSPNARGVWFTVPTGVVDQRSSTTFPTPLFEDGKYQLIWNTGFTASEAQVQVEGLFANGNDVFSTPDGNPAKFNVGDTISADTFNESVFTDLGPTFGNWELGDYGFLGLVFPIAGETHYGYAEIGVNLDASVTLYSFGYNDVADEAVQPQSTLPEPATISLCTIALIGFANRRPSRA